MKRPTIDLTGKKSVSGTRRKRAEHQSAHALLIPNATIADRGASRATINVSLKILYLNNTKLIDKSLLPAAIEGYCGVVRESVIY
ncbi:TPA: hypothetical protein I8190_005570 [Citrobacter freundii]|nr:hypothetical protein [Citrobacter freundii]HAT2288600.1 hypothetical protein [Citrobacter freundii]HAT2347970.1 hypothetical protein [Citrobacter freundii]HAT2352719.1 hypothetical protein [Citrobacter freundii]HAT2429560.1 hypothetical protein [Citrobacter freundii]